MVGVICKREVCAHPIVTIRCFGWKVFWHALFAGPNQTFLGLIAKYSDLAPVQMNVAKLFGRCIKLEQRANKLYNGLAKRWRHNSRISCFLHKLADQELTHVELLQLCRQLAINKRQHDTRFVQWENTLPKLEQSMDDAERKSRQSETEQDILQLVLSVEGSEINRVFSGVVDATDSPFVRRLGVFQQAEQEHIGFICDQVLQMQPGLAEECKKLQTCCLKVSESAECQ